MKVCVWTAMSAIDYWYRIPDANSIQLPAEHFRHLRFSSWSCLTQLSISLR